MEGNCEKEGWLLPEKQCIKCSLQHGLYCFKNWNVGGKSYQVFVRGIRLAFLIWYTLHNGVKSFLKEHS